MWKLTRKGLVANRLRFLLTGVAVVLGVAFVSGTLVLTATIQKTFDDLFANIYSNTDAVVRAHEVLSSDFGSGDRPNIPVSLLATVRKAPGVKAAEGGIGIAYAQIVDANGKVVGSPGQGPPTLGFAWQTDDQLASFHLVEGSPPSTNDEIVIDKHSADQAKLKVGDRTKILTSQAPKVYSLVGIAKFGNADSLAGASATLFDLPEAQRLANAKGQFSQISVVADSGVSQDQVKANIAQTLKDNGAGQYEVITGKAITKENQDSLHDQLQFINVFLGVFALVALVVGSFIIYNTFSIVVAQRTREMALLRAIGASRAQIMRQVLGESVLVGLIASIVGIVAGVLLAVLLKAAMSLLGFDLPGSSIVVHTNAIVVGLIVGLVITVLSAIVPAWQASRVSPVAAMRDVQIERATRRGVRLGIGLTLLVLGIVALFVGVSGSVDNGIAYVGIGALVVFVAAFVLGPLFARITSLAVGIPIARLKGITGTLARENAARNPKRTATTATALVIGIALVGFITIFAASAKASVSHAVDEQFKTDYIIRSGSGFGAGGLSPDLAKRLGALPQVQAVTGLRGGNAAIDGNRTFLTAVEPNAASQLFDFTDVAGSWKSLHDDGLAVSKKKADDHHWKLGDPVMVTFVETGKVPMKIEYIYKENTFGDYYVSQGAFEKNNTEQLDFFVFAKLKPDVTAQQGRAAISPLLAAYPNAKLQDNAQFKADQEAQVNKFVALVYLLLFFALVIALIGIANTLALSIYERTREIGLLRAVGMSRRQVRSAIRWESVIIALLGAVNGLAIGLFFGWSVVRALRSQGITEFAFAPAPLLVVVIIITGLSVVAAWLPARRAAKLDVLRAVSTE
ncbi:MAG: putative transport system permease protein [Actinomycetota bacterium]|nr:putative transport system permease protein [Actinomycetota bacterium]